MIKIGIECENLEDPKSRWGVGQVTLNLLKEYAANPEWYKKYKLYLYFKKRIPDDQVFKNPIFVKRVLGFSSFNIFYHILMPLRAMADRLDWMFFPAYQLPPLYLGRSVVMLTHDVYYEYKYGDLPFRYKLSYRLFTNWAAKFATKVLAISETSKKELVRLYSIKPEKIFVSYLGVGTNQNVKIKMQNDSSKFKNSDYILYIGQAFPRRHLKETILAFKQVADEFRTLKLIAVGRDKYKPSQIRELIKDTNKELGGERVIHYNYIEERDDLEELYAGAKALIYVSDREAFGLPPMEALSFGVPPVIMDNELGHELFNDHVFYSKSGSVDDITKAVRDVLNNDQRAMSIRNSGPEFTRKYSWKSFANKFFNNVKN